MDSRPTSDTVPRGLYAALFLITLATLMFELLLTRIFSITLWYHFAFMVVSVAMFGLAGGALAVHFRPELFTPERAPEQMGRASFAFAIGIIASVLLHVSLPAQGSLALMATYLILTVPFFFSGVAVCIALTRFPHRISRLYAADLLGAALGCIVIIGLLRFVDGVSAVFAIAFLAATAALLLLPRGRRLRRPVLLTLVLTGGLAVCNASLAHLQQPHLRVRWTKTGLETDLLYEKWNHFSRIGVYDDASELPSGWGLSSVYKPTRPIPQLWLRMDGVAGTLLTDYGGDLGRLEYLRYDISNLVHYLRAQGPLLVIGAGGGRDVLSARLFGHREIVAVELNDDILETVNGRFGAFTGHLNRLEGVRFINDEARAWIAQSDESFDVIQASWIDTWAATAAGAFVLTENSLYTVDAWKIFLEHLTPTGILTMTREYTRDDPRHAARLLALGRGTLEALGYEHPERHLILVVHQQPRSLARPVPGNSTILLSPTPFSAEDLARIRRVTDELQFDLAWAPEISTPEIAAGFDGAPADPDEGPALDSLHADLFRTVATGEGLEELKRTWPFRIDPPTSDSPFFFNMVRMGQLLSPEIWRTHRNDPNLRAVSTLLVLQLLVVALALVCLVLPLVLSRRIASPPPGSGWLLLFFCSIGLGFMLIEVAEMQQLAVFLGHPTYGLAVVLFSLLLGSGLGSWWTERLDSGRIRRAGAGLISVLLLALGATGIATPSLVEAFQRESTPTRIAVAAVVMFGLGLLMGTAFPIGMKAARDRAQILTPWFWGMNGATSVVASVAAVVLSLEWGIHAAYWSGVAAYVLALLAVLGATRSPGRA